MNYAKTIFHANASTTCPMGTRYAAPVLGRAVAWMPASSIRPTLRELRVCRDGVAGATYAQRPGA